MSQPKPDSKRCCNKAYSAGFYDGRKLFKKKCLEWAERLDKAEKRDKLDGFTYYDNTTVEDVAEEMREAGGE